LCAGLFAPLRDVRASGENKTEMSFALPHFNQIRIGSIVLLPSPLSLSCSLLTLAVLVGHTAQSANIMWFDSRGRESNRIAVSIAEPHLVQLTKSIGSLPLSSGGEVRR